MAEDGVRWVGEQGSVQRRRLSKTDFQRYRACAKTEWLRRNRPDTIEWPMPSAADRARMMEGQEVERIAGDFVRAQFDPAAISTQATYETEDLVARADFVRAVSDGSIDIVEVKASTSVKRGGDQDHVGDVAFQVLVAERAGQAVARAYVVHLNGDYRRGGDLDVAQLFQLVDVTDDVRALLEALALEVDEACQFLALGEIDEDGCDCRFVGAARRCEAFAHFNPAIPADSAHFLPRVSAARLKSWDGNFGLGTIDPGELTAGQLLVHRAFQEGPIVNREGIRRFLDALRYPIHFYDYETTGPAIPPVDGYRPYQALPVQFSLHVLSENGRLEHFEWVADRHGQQRELVEQLERVIGDEGSLIAWNKSFENGCNRRLADLFPDEAAFLGQLVERTADLEDPFKKDFVHWGFRGSTSIKKVLPVLYPALRYAIEEVHDGTGAVEAWTRMIGTEDESLRADLRRQLLAYCELDSLAMVKIYGVLRDTVDNRVQP